ncbi:MAG: hypothetical protein RJA70_464 [Pseudomonadota bacterium]
MVEAPALEDASGDASCAAAVGAHQGGRGFQLGEFAPASGAIRAVRDVFVQQVLVQLYERSALRRVVAGVDQELSQVSAVPRDFVTSRQTISLLFQGQVPQVGEGSGAVALLFKASLFCFKREQLELSLVGALRSDERISTLSLLNFGLGLSVQRLTASRDLLLK